MCTHRHRENERERQGLHKSIQPSNVGMSELSSNVDVMTSYQVCASSIQEWHEVPPIKLMTVLPHLRTMQAGVPRGKYI